MEINEDINVDVFEEFDEPADGYLKNGVLFSPTNPSAGTQLKIQYNGLLAQSGAPNVYIHIGSSNDGIQWKDVQDSKMMSVGPQEFEITIPYSKDSIYHVAFHDELNNWDNNNGYDYHFKLRERPMW